MDRRRQTPNKRSPGVTANEEEAAGAINQTVAIERELQLNALAKDKAMSDADAGNYHDAADSLRANAKKLEAVAASAPDASEGKPGAASPGTACTGGETLAAGGMSKSLRKTIQNESYSRKNGKEQ